MTVNELMALQKAVRERAGALKALRTQVAVKERWYGVETQQHAMEPQYDVKAVDKKIMELENFLYKADAAIKQSNAKTDVDIKADADALLSPLE